ncbi:hypothetical protein KCP74_23015 [Salmonella enterica subsp. enterica]|nr:hypothetical protein KCP74_23015 [Salmonella enterica subsp. enterica]
MAHDSVLPLSVRFTFADANWRSGSSAAGSGLRGTSCCLSCWRRLSRAEIGRTPEYLGKMTREMK